MMNVENSIQISAETEEWQSDSKLMSQDAIDDKR